MVKPAIQVNNFFIKTNHSQYIEMKLYIFIAVVLVLIYLLSRGQCHEDYMYGMWLADGDDFCRDSEIESMAVFIGRPTAGWGIGRERVCYIIIMNDLCSQAFTITYNSRWVLPGTTVYRVSVGSKFDEVELWPERVYFDIDICKGTLKIHEGDQVYALLAKQHNITNDCEELEKADAS